MKPTGKKRMIAFFLCSLIIGCASAKKKLPRSIWQGQAIAVDGNDSDWPSPYPFMDDKAGIQYAVSNNKRVLYITASTNDELIQAKLLRAGMQVWIDMSGDKNLTQAVCFPLKNENPVQAKEGRMKDPQRMGSMGMSKEMISQAREYRLDGLDGCSGTYLLQQRNKCDVFVRIGFNENNTLVWEAAIPIGAFYKDEIDSTDLATAFGICFEINGMPRPEPPSGEFSRGDKPPGMPPSGGGNRPMREGPPIGGQGGPPGSMPDMSKLDKSQTWMKMTFAYE